MPKDPKKELEQRIRLDAISSAKERYVIAKSRLEYQLREKLKEELSNLQSQLDINVRYAVDSGCSKASVLRALGTRDYHTLNASLSRTEGVEEDTGTAGFDDVYSFDLETGEFSVTYDSHGPDSVSGAAVFDFRILNDGTKWFMARTSLWNEDFTVRNDVVASLDNRQSGYYYDEALAWVERVISGK
jgi:hypothetical protein